MRSCRLDDSNSVGRWIGRRTTRARSLLVVCLLVEIAALLSGARAAQDICERVVSFMARVLEDRLVGRGPRVLTRPGPRPRLRIFDGEPVHQRLAVGTPEPLDDVELIGGSAESCFA